MALARAVVMPCTEAAEILQGAGPRVGGGGGVGMVSLYHVNSFLQVEFSIFPVLVHIFKRTLFLGI